MLYNSAEQNQELDIFDLTRSKPKKKKKKKITKESNRLALESLDLSDLYDSVYNLCICSTDIRNNVDVHPSVLGDKIFKVYHFTIVCLDDLSLIKSKIDKSTYYFLNYTFMRIQGICNNYVFAESLKVSNAKGDLTSACYQILDHLVRTDLVDYKKDFPDMPDTKHKAHFKNWVKQVDHFLPESESEIDHKYVHRY